jgi:hypothetical protein
MNEHTKELTKRIDIVWEEIRKAAKNEDFASLQASVGTLSKCLDLKEKSRLLELQIANLSVSKPAATNQPEPLNNPGPFKKTSTNRPQELRIGDHRFAISMSNQIPIIVANWLLGQGKTLPVVPNFLQPTNRDFASSAVTKKLNNGSFIEVGDAQPTLIQKARRLLNACGYRDTNLEVLLEDGSLKVG